MMWATVLLASAACYALKALGFVVPDRFLDKPIGGGELAAFFLRAYEAAEPLEILEKKAGFVVRAETKRARAEIDDAPGLVPVLSADKVPRQKIRQRSAAFF